MGFIRKVYAIVLAQLAYTGASSVWLAHRPDVVQAIAKPGDYVVCLGAGNITQWAYALPGELQALG